MSKSTTAFLLNLISFGILFVFFRLFIGHLLPLSHLPLLLGSAILASFVSPKFFVKNKSLWVKIFWRKSPFKLQSPLNNLLIFQKLQVIYYNEVRIIFRKKKFFYYRNQPNNTFQVIIVINHCDKIICYSFKSLICYQNTLNNNIKSLKVELGLRKIYSN